MDKFRCTRCGCDLTMDEYRNNVCLCYSCCLDLKQKEKEKCDIYWSKLKINNIDEILERKRYKNRGNDSGRY